MTDVKHIVSISGGKDSTALLLLAIERGIDFEAVFADTGHEHPDTYDYVAYLAEATGVPIRWVRQDFTGMLRSKRRYVARQWEMDLVNEGWPAWQARERVMSAIAVLQPTGIPFLDLCLAKGRFPSTRARFCSQELKHEAIWQQIKEPAIDAGYEVVSWQGVRADESRARADAAPIEDVGGGMWNYRPLLDWTAEDVFEMHRRHGIAPNPLYTQGMGRVGCMPCIHASKAELRTIAARFPEEIARVEEWERMVAQASKRGRSTLFAADKTPGEHNQDHSLPMPGVWEVVEWSRTSRGGRQYDMLAETGGDVPACSSIYGLCE